MGIGIAFKMSIFPSLWREDFETCDQIPLDVGISVLIDGDGSGGVGAVDEDHALLYSRIPDGLLYLSCDIQDL